MMSRGHYVFSPIAHTHPIAVSGGMDLDWTQWEYFDRWFLERCDELLVLMLPDWTLSKGVAAKMAIARELGKPVEYCGRFMER